MWFGKPKLPVDLDEFDWLMACFAWVHYKLRDAPGGTRFTPILARHDTPIIANAEGATSLFAAVKTISGLCEWECRLEQGPSLIQPIDRTTIGEFSSRNVLGTYSIEGNVPVIRYDPALLRDPYQLTATFAHELSHLLGHTLGLPPGGEELEEHATDCIAVYLGFGSFLANCSRNFSQFTEGNIQGWQSNASGYLSERALVTLTAMFVRLFEIPPLEAKQELKPYLQKDFAKALAYIDRQFPDFERELLAIDLVDWA